MLPMAVVLALKLTDIAAAATVTDAGTVSVALVLVKVTAAPPVGAGWVSVTTHALEALGPRLVGAQTSDETSTDAVSVTVALAEALL